MTTLSTIEYADNGSDLVVTGEPLHDEEPAWLRGGVAYITLMDIFAYADIDDVYVTREGLVRFTCWSRKSKHFVEALEPTLEDAMEKVFDRLLEEEFKLNDICDTFDVTPEELRELLDMEPIFPISLEPVDAKIGQPVIIATDGGIFRIERLNEMTFGTEDDLYDMEDAWTEDDLGNICG